jgi:hypothetical protein
VRVQADRVQRREWAAETAHYLAAYRERFPREYTIWTTHQHHAAHREGKKLKPLKVGPGDRVGIMRLGRCSLQSS